MIAVNVRKLQREYKKIFEEVNIIKEPIIILSNNKPQCALISLELLEKIKMEDAIREVLKEFRVKKKRPPESFEAVEKEFSKVRKAFFRISSQKRLK